MIDIHRTGMMREGRGREMEEGERLGIDIDNCVCMKNYLPYHLM